MGVVLERDTEGGLARSYANRINEIKGLYDVIQMNLSSLHLVTVGKK